MGKTLPAIFGHSKSSKNLSKLKNFLSLAVARLSILKNHHQARCSIAHGDIAGLLKLGHTDRALLRAEYVVKEENLLDVFAMIQFYCHLITERAILLRHQKECPNELKEAISSLIYASSRSGEMPELYHVCNLFASMFGREFVRAATELRNCCGVNLKIVQKLSTKQPSLENRIRIIKEIAAEIGITLGPGFEEDPFAPSNILKVDPNKSKNQDPHVVDTVIDSSMRAGHNYKDVASAAKAACEKAEDAAAAARAAVELSRSSQSSTDNRNNRNNDDVKEDQKHELQQVDKDANITNVNINPVQDYTSGSEEEDLGNKNFTERTEQVSDSSDTVLEENKPNKFSMENNESHALLDDKSESETDKIMENFDHIYQKKYPVRKMKESFKSPLHSESDTAAGLLTSAHEDELAKSYYSVSKNSRKETVRIDYTEKTPTEPSKVSKRAVSVRTRRGMQK